MPKHRISRTPAPVEWLRLNDSLRHRVAARDLEGLAAHPALAETAQALVRGGLTTEPELARVLGFPTATP